MAIVEIDLAQLTTELLSLIDKLPQSRHLGRAVLETLYATGLRVNEVVEVERWAPQAGAVYFVQLSKREGIRAIDMYSIPEIMREYYDTGTPLIYETYSSINHIVKRWGPVLFMGSDKNTTTTHAFRYRYIKQLLADGTSIQEIASIMGHISTSSTARYAYDPMRMVVPG